LATVKKIPFSHVLSTKDTYLNSGKKTISGWKDGCKLLSVHYMHQNTPDAAGSSVTFSVLDGDRSDRTSIATYASDFMILREQVYYVAAGHFSGGEISDVRRFFGIPISEHFTIEAMGFGNSSNKAGVDGFLEVYFP
jgi:hypothetical protein